MLARTAPAERTYARCNAPWPQSQIELLQRHWPDIEKLKLLIPDRSETALRSMASKYRLTHREAHVWTGAECKKLRHFTSQGMSLRDMAAALNVRPGQVRNRMIYDGLTIARRPPAAVPDPLANEIRQRAFEMKLTLAQLDLSLGMGKAMVFSKRCFSKQGASPRAIMQAVAALGGRLVIEWEPLQ